MTACECNHGLGKNHLMPSDQSNRFSEFQELCGLLSVDNTKMSLKVGSPWNMTSIWSTFLHFGTEMGTWKNDFLFALPLYSSHISCISYISEHAPVNPLISYDVSLLQFSEDNRKTSYECFLFKIFTKGGTWLPKCEFACCSRLGYKWGVLKVFY